MTVSITNARDGPFTPNGLTTSFPFTFRAISTGDVVPTLNDVVQTTGFTVTLNSDGVGGAVVFNTAPASGTLYIQSVPDFTQDVSFENAGAFLPETHDLALDRAVVRDIYLDHRIDGSVRLPEHETLGALPAASSRQDRFLRFSPDGLSIVLASVTDTALALLSALVTLLGSAFKGDPGSPGEGYSTRASMALAGNAATALDDTYLTERGRQGKFIFYTAALYTIDFPTRVLTADVTGDPNQAFLIAKQSDASGAGGAWVRIFDGPVDPRWGGLVPGDDVSLGAANSGFNDQLLTTCDALDHRHIKFRGGIPYRLAARMDVKYPDMVIEGPGGGLGATDPILKFPGSVGGIAIQGSKTNGPSGYDAVSHSTGSGTTLQSLTIDGGFTGTEGEFHGVQLRTKSNVRDCTILNFPGEGIRASGSTSAGAQVNGAEPPYGNLNTSLIDRVTVDGNRTGLKIDGNDANAITLGTINSNNNREWSQWDSSFLGNTALAGQNNNNGTTGNNDGVTIGASVVSHGGNWYAAITEQETGASTNAPSGTTASNAWWMYLSAGAAVSGKPAWFNGVLVRAGGAGYYDNNAARSLVLGQYVEPNQGKIQTTRGALVIGGKAADWVFINPAADKSGGVIRGHQDGVIYLEPGIAVISGTVTAALGANNGNASYVLSKFSEPTYLSAGLTQHVNAASGDIFLTHGTNIDLADTFMRLLGPVSTTVTGSGGTHPKSVFIPRLLLRASGGTVADAKIVYRAAAVTDSAAVDVAGVNTKINAILAALRAAGLMTT